MLKTYYEQIDEITTDELYEGLLGYGLFSEKLPPIFQSESFYDWCNKNPNLLTFKCPAGYIYFESMRNVNIPRQLGIPHPFAYERLCNTLKLYWSDLKAHYKKNTEFNKYKVSRIHIRKRQGRKSIFEMNYKKLLEDGAPIIRLAIGKKYAVKSDITSCFPSIYTHALGWALVGKDKSKKEKNNKKFWTNEIDFYTRNTKWGETNGLLIGPHASNVLSELILTTIDKALVDKGYEFIRNIDDYYCLTETYERAESFIQDLVTELKNYNLSVNQKKTQILQLPLTFEEEWVHAVSDVPSEGKGGVVALKTVKKYLDQAILLMKESGGNAAPINYVIKVLASLNFGKLTQEYIVNTILHWAIIYPYLLPLIHEYVFDHYIVTENQIRDFSFQLCLDSLERRNYEGVNYALFFAIKYNVSFNIKELKDKVLLDEDFLDKDCIMNLIMYLYFKQFGEKELVDKLIDKARNLLHTDSMDENWLFIYEVLDGKDLEGCNHWINIKKADVSFIKSEYRY